MKTTKLTLETASMMMCAVNLAYLREIFTNMEVDGEDLFLSFDVDLDDVEFVADIKRLLNLRFQIHRDSTGIVKYYLR